MRAKIIGYAILVAVFVVSMPFANEYGTWLPVVAAMVAIALAVQFGQINVGGITIVFFIAAFLIPIAVLYVIGLQAQMDAPLRQVFERYDWMRVVLPWLFAILTYYAFLKIRQRGKPKTEN